MSHRIGNSRQMGGGWYEGKQGIYRWQALVFDEPSRFGLDEGRVSKLWIKNTETGQVVFNFDRGLDFDLTDSPHPVVVCMDAAIETADAH